MLNIVFTFETGRLMPIIESFGFRDTSCILPGDLSEQFLAGLMQEVIRESKEHRTQIRLMASRCSETRFFVTEEVLYIESLGNRKCICTKRECFEFYGEMYRLERITDPFGFIRIHHGFIVSPAHIVTANSRSVVMDNGKIINIGKGYRKRFREELRQSGFLRLNGNRDL